MATRLKPGDLIIYRKQKFSTRPGPRAREIRPATNGDDYAYCVDKFWVIDTVKNDGGVLVRTRTGKKRLVGCEDPGLRKARWWERLLYLSRFPKTPSSCEDSAAAMMRHGAQRS